MKGIFLFPNNNTLDIIPEKVPWWEPYRYICGAELNFTTSGIWRFNLTGSFEMKFLLPSGTEPVSTEISNAMFNIEDDRPVAYFRLNSPISFPTGRWLVEFDVVSLRNFYWQEIISTVILIVLFVASLVIAPTSKREKQLGISIPITSAGGVLSYNVLQFFILNGPNLRMFFSIMIVFDVFLVAGIVISRIIRYLHLSWHAITRFLHNQWSKLDRS